MKSLILIATFAFSTTTFAASIFSCKCTETTCVNTDPVKVSFDIKSLRFDIESANWSYHGYATAQVSKTLEHTYLTLPRAYTIPSITAEIKKDGSLYQLRIGSESIECTKQFVSLERTSK